MSLRKYAPPWFLALAMAGTAFGSAPQDGQSPKQDMKDAGKSCEQDC
jgi:hypothetical protein